MDKNKNEKQQYPGLENLSMGELDELIRQDFDVTDATDLDYFRAISEVIGKRAAEDPDYKPFDVEAGWKNFEENYLDKEFDISHHFPSYHTPEVGSDTTAPEKHRRSSSRKLRRTVAAAALLVVLFGMLTAQALGYELFQSIARWTSDVFTFGASSSETFPTQYIPMPIELPPDREYLSLQEVLDDVGIALPLVPTWHPDRFVQSQLTVRSFSDRLMLDAYFVDGDCSFSIGVIVRNTLDGAARFHEINEGSVYEYVAHGVIHYIMSNYDRAVAVWMNGTIEVFIQGNVTEADLIKMIDSVYGG